MYDLSLRELSEDDINKILDVFFEIFPEGQLSLFGRGTVKKYYLEFFGDHDSYIIGAFSGEELVGFVEVSKNSIFNRIVRKHFLYLLATSFLALIRTPVKFISALRSYSMQTKSNLGEAEISYIGVKKKWRRKGIGKKLVVQANQIAIKKRISSMFTKTLENNTHVQGMYTKLCNNTKIVDAYDDGLNKYVYVIWNP